MGRLAGFTDSRGVDGAVNATALSVIFSGRSLTNIQTGRLRNYIGIALAGALILVIVNYILF